MDLLISSIVVKRGSAPPSELSSKVFVLLYFSSRACPPCLRLTPMLSEFYYEANKSGHQLEFILVSFDETKAEYERNWAAMPFASINYGNKALCESLWLKSGIRGIPALVLIDKDVNIVKTDCLEDIQTTSCTEALEIWRKLLRIVPSTKVSEEALGDEPST